MIRFEDIIAGMERCFAAQHSATEQWHESEPESVEAVAAYCAAYCATDGDDAAGLLPLVLAQHLMNFKLWHVEDVARRTDVGPEVIADCKRRIDGYNQRRNDYMEKVDAWLVHAVTPLLAQAQGAVRYNSESAGMAVDRLSILSLKMYHMREQTERQDADAAHVARCAEKLAVLTEQRHDLARAVLELLEDYRSGHKRPKVYYQCKMYNDPSLNPQLYGAEKAKG